jgi:Glycosyl transferase family 2
MDARPGTPAITVLIATNDGWSALRRAYAPLRPQVERDDAEVLLVNGSREPQPSNGELTPTTRWIDLPGADLAELRMHGYREARGEIVAMTEDHVEVAPNWVEEILASYRRYPNASAIGGAVRNGTPNHIIDWAGFYAGHAPFMEPLPNGETEWLSGINVAYRRDALRDALERVGDRAIETLINEEIKAAGGLLVADDRLVVSHFQSRGIATTLHLHYYAGRHYEGTRSLEGVATMGRALRALALPLPRSAKRLATALRKGEPIDRVARVAPAIFLALTAQAAGELEGIFRGPGRSATKLH